MGRTTQTPQTVQSATVTLTTSQIKALHSSPVQLVPAAPAGSVVWPLWFTEYLNAGATAYSFGGQTRILWAGQSAGGSLFMSSPVDTIGLAHTDQMFDGYYEPHEIGGISYDATLGDPADGDGTITVTVYYLTVATA